MYPTIKNFKTNKAVFIKKCKVTNENYIVRVPLDKYYDWKHGALIQDVFPELSKEQREFMISGTTPAEWHKFFGEET